MDCQIPPGARAGDHGDPMLKAVNSAPDVQSFPLPTAGVESRPPALTQAGRDGEALRNQTALATPQTI